MDKDIHLVTLGLGQEIFAVPVGCVIEIVAMRELFRVPDAPDFLAGLADIREQAVPVIDLRRKFGMQAAEITHQTRIIVLEVAVASRRLVVGLIADRVIEVITLASGQIGPKPDIGHVWGSAYIAGVARHGANFVIVFDMARLFKDEDVTAIVAEGAAEPAVRAA
jgi:purine-binding chemotaxis protein CheW